MNRATFDHTVSVLVKAYLKGTLEHGNCVCCAVGNLIADAKGYKIIRENHPCKSINWHNKKGDIVYPRWDNLFVSDGGDLAGNFQTINPKQYKGWLKREVDSTGYHWTELAEIEKAFEKVYYTSPNDTEENLMFNGLMAVVDVLASIHNVDLSTKEQAKLLFVK